MTARRAMNVFIIICALFAAAIPVLWFLGRHELNNSPCEAFKDRELGSIPSRCLKEYQR